MPPFPSRQPEQVAAAFQQALRWHQRGHLREALDSYETLLAAAPGHAPSLHYSGVILLQLGRSAEAVARIRRALAVDAGDVDAWSNLALAYQALGQHDAAIAALTEATRRAPRDPELLANLAGALLDAGRPADAEQAARGCIDANPGKPSGWFNLALALQAMARLPDALAAVTRALALDANALPAVGVKAQLEDALGDRDAARTTLENALARSPHVLPLRFQLAECLEGDAKLVDAANAYETVLRAEPRHGAALSQLHFLRKRIVDWRGLGELRTAFRIGVSERRPMLSPFCLLSDPSTRAEQRLCAETWVATVAPPSPAAAIRPIAAPSSRLRIGYLSADLHSHATAFLAAGVFEAHDRSRFEISAYSTGPDDGSPMRARLERAFGGLVDARGWALERLASRIRDDRLDVLVDLKGHTEGAPTRVLAHRPAPVQVHWLGYPGTTGAPYIDYLIGDATVSPFEHSAAYTEALVQMPHSYQPNDRVRPIAESAPREELGLPTGMLVFCCFNNPYKYSPEYFDALGHIAKAVPDSVLWFLARGASDPAIENIRLEAGRREIANRRVIFATARPNAEYLALYRHADLFLDTWPYNGHTTVSDALWAGCPVIALLGDTFAGRVAASLLTAIGLPELIAPDVDGYSELVIALARDGERRAALRTYLAGPGNASPLFDTLATTRALEAAYIEMAAQHRAGVRRPFRVDRPGQLSWPNAI